MDTLKSNKLIAEFMGLNKEDKARIKHFFNEKLCYDTSWDWLMPVIEKIGEFQFDDKDYAHIRTFRKNMVRINRFSLHQEKTLIKSAHNAVVEFINWYNKRR
jgi:hypothetical protein